MQKTLANRVHSLVRNCSRRNGIFVCDPGGFRCLHSGIRLFTERSKEEDRSKTVVKSWVNSILGSSSSEGKEVSEDSVKRPLPVFRRRTTDNMWTKEPIDDKIIWVDCEMTGLNPDKDKLMEIGIMITDANLNVIAQHDSLIFHIDEPILQGMDPWCQRHHGNSGLTEAARKSTITHEAADENLLKFVQTHTKPGECPMAGNSIGQDRMFIMRQLPKFYSHFHYRSIDVSTIKELVRRWYPEIASLAPKKLYSHRVLDDISDSITELKFYRSTVFNSRQNASAKAADEVAKRSSV